jgi:hypothetical protein
MGIREDFFNNVNKKRSVKVFFTNDDGEKTELFTEINGTPEQVLNYYERNYFNFGDDDFHKEDLMMIAEKIIFLEEKITVNFTYSKHKGGHC